MKTSVQINKPSLRCSECGKTNIVAICHHCGTPFCNEHQSPAGKPKPQSFEFASLGLEHAGHLPPVIHCSRCEHLVPTPASKAKIIILFVIAFGFLPAGAFGATFFYVVSGIFLTWAVLAAVRRLFDWKSALAARPDFPALPQFRSFEVHETVRGRQVLNGEGSSRTEVLTAQGRAAVHAVLTQNDGERLNLYAKKYKLSDRSNIAVFGGSIAFSPAVTPSTDDGGQPLSLKALRSTVSDLPFFQGDPKISAADWRMEASYSVGSDSNPTAMPLRIVPSLVPDRARQELQLDLIWRSLPSRLAVESIDSLELSYPAELGSVKCNDGWESDDNSASRLTDNAWLTARVIRPQVSPPGSNKPLNLNADTHKREFFFHFERAIRPGMALRGRATMFVRGSLSGLERAYLFSPLGVRRDQTPPEILTKLELEFELDTTSLLNSVLKLAPAADGSKTSSASTPTSPGQVFEGVEASPTLIISLTDILTDSGYYIKSVTEENPRQHHKNSREGQLRHRTWDLLGRRYDGIHPTDFHLVLQGEESPSHDRFSLTANLSAQGAHSDDESGDDVDRTWKDVSDMVVDVVQRAASTMTHPTPLPPPPEPTAHGQLSAPPKAAITAEISPPSEGAASNRSAKRDRLLDLYTEGVISAEDLKKRLSEAGL